MKEGYQHLRRQMQANFELTWAGQADSNKRIREISARLDEQAGRIDHQAQKIEEHGQKIARQGEEIARQGQEIARQGQQIGEGLRETARLGREVASLGDQMVGRLRLMSDRFGRFLDVLEGEATEQSSRIDDLDVRVTRLEERQGPAA